MIYLGTNLRYLRKLNKLSQNDLAKVLQVHRQQIAQYELEINRPSFEMLIKMDYFLIA